MEILAPNVTLMPTGFIHYWMLRLKPVVGKILCCIVAKVMEEKNIDAGIFISLIEFEKKTSIRKSRLKISIEYLTSIHLIWIIEYVSDKEGDLSKYYLGKKLFYTEKKLIRI